MRKCAKGRWLCDSGQLLGSGLLRNRKSATVDAIARTEV